LGPTPNPQSPIPNPQSPFAPLNSHNFKNEIFIRHKIKYYFLYFYNKYYDEYVNNRENKSENSNNFITYLEEDILLPIVGDENYDDFIEDASSKIKLEDLGKKKY